MTAERDEPDTAAIVRRGLARDAKFREQADRDWWSRAFFGQSGRRTDPDFERFKEALNPKKKDV